MAALLGLALLVACGGRPAGTPSERLQAAIDGIVDRDDSVPGVLLVVHAPEVTFEGASGVFAFGQARPLLPDDLFRSASATKTFVAAATLVLVEQGRLSLDDPLRERLTPASIAALEGGGYDVDAITVGELLGHTAGIVDYTEMDAFYATIEADPHHRWSRAEQLALAMTGDGPLNAPGAEYHYGDTHYILAGEVLEVATGGTLAAALRDTLRLDALGVRSTWLESLEDPPATDAFDRLSHPYIDGEDTRDWDPSWDLFGGGGLASSTGDLARFVEALFARDGGVFADPRTLDRLLTIPDAGVGAYFGIDGGLGINRFDVDGADCWAGYGFFGTEVVRCPDLDLTWAATVNQSDPARPDAVADAVLGVALE